MKALPGDHSCDLNAWELESGKLLQIKGIVGYVMSSKLLGLQRETMPPTHTQNKSFGPRGRAQQLRACTALTEDPSLVAIAYIPDSLKPHMTTVPGPLLPPHPKTHTLKMNKIDFKKGKFIMFLYKERLKHAF